MEIALVKRYHDDDDDRVYLTVDGHTRRGPVHVMHDLPHLVVESLFGIGDGLWGELAAGRHDAASRATTARDPKRRKAGRIVSGAATGARTEEWLSSGHRAAKVITNAVVNRGGDGPDTPAGVRARLAGQGSPEVAAVLGRVSDHTIATAIAGVRIFQLRWMATPAGQKLHLSWPMPGDALDPPQ